MNKMRTVQFLTRRVFSSKQFNLKSLRDETGAPLIKCKEALDKFSDFDQAIQYLREKNMILAKKKQGNDAKISILGLASTPNSFLSLRVNSETDFVARNSDFLKFVNASIAKVVDHQHLFTEGLNSVTRDVLDGVRCAVSSLRDDQDQITARTQEKIEIAEVFKDALAEGEVLGTYVHKQLRENIGPSFAYVVFRAEGNASGQTLREVGDQLAAHVFCEMPEFVSMDQIPGQVIQEKRSEFEAEIRSQHARKPKEIQERILSGKLSKEFDELVLLNQRANFWNQDKTVSDYLKEIEKTRNIKIHVCRFKIFKSS